MANNSVRNLRPAARRAGLNVVCPPDSSGSRVPLGYPRDPETNGAGIEVQEEELGSVIAQHVYKMRCKCGRSWFELELKRFVTCPACRKLALVTAEGQPAR
jgi:hypothetical protein